MVGEGYITKLTDFTTKVEVDYNIIPVIFVLCGHSVSKFGPIGREHLDSLPRFALSSVSSHGPDRTNRKEFSKGHQPRQFAPFLVDGEPMECGRNRVGFCVTWQSRVCVTGNSFSVHDTTQCKCNSGTLVGVARARTGRKTGLSVMVMVMVLIPFRFVRKTFPPTSPTGISMCGALGVELTPSNHDVSCPNSIHCFSRGVEQNNIVDVV